MFDSTSIEITPPLSFWESLWRASQPNQNVSPANVFPGNPVAQPLLALWIHGKKQQPQKQSQVRQCTSYLLVAFRPRSNLNHLWPRRSELARDNVSELHHNVQHDTGSSSWQRASQKRTADGVFIQELKAVQESKKLFCGGDVLIV